MKRDFTGLALSMALIAGSDGANDHNSGGFHQHLIYSASGPDAGSR